MKNKVVKIIGAGLAGCEAAYQIAKRGIAVVLYEAKPDQKSAAHHTGDFAELVCSNSLKSLDQNTAHGLLKAELRLLDSLILTCAERCRVPAGGALAVDRELFSALVTKTIKENPLIQIVHGTVDSFTAEEPIIIATGPLTVGRLAEFIKAHFEGNLSFYDAAAPIISGDSINKECAFIADRYGKGNGNGDYINCPMTADEYYVLINALVKAECVVLKDFEQGGVFEGCMPVEIMAARGRDTLRFGPLKPVGFIDPKTSKRPFAVVQLRRENTSGEMYNLVGFQTNLTFSEQKRVFSLIPALQKAEYLRYGVMHRNTYINAPKILNRHFQAVKSPNVFIAGQLSGVEGYVESTASGLVAGIYMAAILNGIGFEELPDETMIGALAKYVTTPNPNFQPMNSNFGILPPLDIRDKNLRKEAYAKRSLAALKDFLSP